jgi:hypothetical protein
MVKPQGGVLDLLVQTGVGLFMAPDAVADESNYKLVSDAGVIATGVLLMTANASGSTRCDVIECQINATDLIVTDNRDIFNPSTGLFTATSVTKERSARLTYRVRAGTPGAGFPGTVSGWLPLAVATVPTATTTNDTITFWDVRPLLADRAIGLFALTQTTPRLRRYQFNALTLTAVTGLMEAELNGRRLGGRLRRGSPGTDADSIDVTIAANRDIAFAATANQPWFLYLCTPFGLPRWAKYTATGTRLPQSPRGIPIASSTPPNPDGNPTGASGAITLPATFFGSNAALALTEAVCVAAGYHTAATTQKGFYGSEGGMLLDGGSATVTDPLQVSGTDATAAGFGIARYDLTSGTHYPANARAILCEFRASVVVGAGGDEILRTRVRTYLPNSTVTIALDQGVESTFSNTAGATLDAVYHSAWVELGTIYPSTTSPIAQRLEAVYDASGFVSSLSTPRLRILGWRL